MKRFFLISLLCGLYSYAAAGVPVNLLTPPASETTTSITLHWDKPEDEKPVRGYEIYRDGEFEGFSRKTNYTVEGLNPASRYSFFVKSKYKTGETSKAGKEIQATTRPAGSLINILDYGAIGDGEFLNTEKIQQAIDDCPAGGTVYIPEGTFLSGALFLKSHMTLFIEKEGVLKGSCFAKHYKPFVHNRFEGWELDTYASLLNAGTLDSKGDYTTQDIVIRGEGTLAGGGMALGGDMIASKGLRGRGRLICLLNCRDVCIQGLTIEDAPSWTIHYIYCKGITLHDLHISSLARNGDGIDPDSSSDSYIFNCTFSTNDDCIAIKSGKNPEGNRIDRPSENIFISHCHFLKGHGISIGSEMSGGVRNIVIRDCIAQNLMHGLQIKSTKDRGGYVENIQVKDCSLLSIRIRTSVNYNNDGEPAPDLPYYRNFEFKCIDMSRSTEKDIIIIEGFDDKRHYTENILLKDIKLPENSRICFDYCRNISLDNVLSRTGQQAGFSIRNSIDIKK